MVEQNVTLIPGESKLVSFEAIPHEARTYQVVVNGLTGSFTVVAAPAKFYMPAQMEVVVTDGTILDMYWNCDFSVLITNIGDAPGTYTINWWDSVDVITGSRQITLQPGESYLWQLSQWVDFRRLASYFMTLQGDWEGDNLSTGEATI